MIKQKVRQKIYLRDGNKCVQCGSKENLTIDHILPLMYGGTNVQENLRTMCRVCNMRKGSRVSLPFFEKVKQLFYFHDILTRFKNEWQGVQSANSKEIEALRAEHGNRIDLLNKQFTEYRTFTDGKIHTLADRLTAMEQYHKIQYTEETIHTKKYTKIKKQPTT